jgi:hypothetical protein
MARNVRAASCWRDGRNAGLEPRNVATAIQAENAVAEKGAAGLKQS